MSTTASRTSPIPVVLSGQALRSLRDSGYSLSAALGEPIDNSIEAEANAIHVWLDEGRGKDGKRHIHRILIVDDGRGMDDDVLHHYLQLGYSSRYMSTKTIGKYGVGAKLAALNFGQRIDVWSRQSSKDPWRHVFFDLDLAEAEERRGNTVGLEAPTSRPIPEDLAKYAPESSGTVVIWSKVDRLEEGRRAADANQLRVEVEKELSRMFRRFINGGIKLTVNGTELLPHDPTFVMPTSWADARLAEHLRKQNKEEGRKHFPAEVLLEEAIKVAGAEFKLRVTFYPEEVTRSRGSGGDNLARELRVPENEGAISFMRLDREINYTNVPRIFPRGVQESDRFVGIEVEFSPAHDDYFGVRNVKRGVEPHDEMRKAIRDKLKKPLEVARKKLEERWGESARLQKKHAGEHTPIAEAAKEVNRTLPKARALGPKSEGEQQRLFVDLAKDVGHTESTEQEAYIQRIRDLPFVMESVDFPGTNFVDVQHVSGKVLIRLNTRHRFYREMWEPLREMADGTAGLTSPEELAGAARRTVEALTLLLITYGKAESMDENPHDRYGDLRSYWGQFLDTMLGKVRNVR